MQFLCRGGGVAIVSVSLAADFKVGDYVLVIADTKIDEIDKGKPSSDDGPFSSFFKRDDPLESSSTAELPLGTRVRIDDVSEEQICVTLKRRCGSTALRYCRSVRRRPSG